MNQKGFANVVLIVVIVAIIAVGGYMIFREKSEPIEQQSSPEPVEQLSTQEPAAEWKTILGSGYQFKVPANWEDKKKESYNNHAHYFTTVDGEIEMWLFENNAKLSLEKWYTEELATPPNEYDRTSYVLATQDGHKVLSNLKAGQQAMYAIELKNQNVLLITCGPGCDNSKFSDLFNPILQTFKF